MHPALDLLKKAISENSEVSMMRIMAAVSLTVGAILAFIGLYKGSELMGLSALVAVFVGSAFGGKVLQKGKENSPE